MYIPSRTAEKFFLRFMTGFNLYMHILPTLLKNQALTISCSLFVHSANDLFYMCFDLAFFIRLKRLTQEKMSLKLTTITTNNFIDFIDMKISVPKQSIQ